MKRLLSLVMVLALVLSLGTVVFADEPVWDGTYDATEAFTFNQVVKNYTSEGNVVVNETLSFTSTASTSNPDRGTANLTVADLVVTSLNPGALTVTVPSLDEAGVYEWTIKENAGSTAGVTYSTDEVHVIVLVEYDNTNHELKIGNTSSYIKGVVTEEDGKEVTVKKNDFTNTFASGSFTVAKDVEGNMASEKDEFEIAVTLTSAKPIGTNITFAGTTVAPSEWVAVKDADEKVTGYTYSKTLKYSELGGAKTFSNIPVGVVVTVAEDTTATKMNGYTYAGTSVDGTVKKTGDNLDASVTFTVADTTNSAVVVHNTNATEVITGISMDSLPYILLLAVACVGIVVLIAKKRLVREN